MRWTCFLLVLICFGLTDPILASEELEQAAKDQDPSIRRPALAKLASQGKKKIIRKCLLEVCDQTGKEVVSYLKKNKRKFKKYYLKELQERQRLALGHAKKQSSDVEEFLESVRVHLDNPYKYLRKNSGPLSKLHAPLLEVFKDAKKYLKTRKGKLDPEFSKKIDGLVDWTQRLMGVAYSKAELKLIKEVETSDDLSEEGRAMLIQVNEYRRLLGLNILKLDPKLVKACRTHSRNMKKTQQVGHESTVRGWKTPEARCQRCGVEGFVGESVAKGSAEQVMKAWMGSKAHHKNFVRDAVFFGIAEVDGYWTYLVAV